MELLFQYNIRGQNLSVQMVRKMSEAAGNFDFMELGQAIMDAREKQRITREELAEELGISARHLQAALDDLIGELALLHELFHLDSLCK